MPEEISIDETIRILEIADLSSAKLADLPLLRRKAQKRWHPDTIASLRPSEETRKRYEANFRNIDAAIGTLERFIRGDAVPGAPEGGAPPPQDEPEDVIRRNAPDMQARLRDLWASARASLTPVDVVIADGWKIGDLLKQDLDDDMPVRAFAGWIGGALPLLMLYDSAAGPARYGYSMAWYAFPTLLGLIGFTLVCATMILPASRFWLPPPVTLIGLYALDIGLWLFRAMHVLMRWVGRFGPILIWAYWAFWLVIILPVMLVRGAQWIILHPLYFVVGNAMEHKRIGRMFYRDRHWHGVREKDINRLLNANPAGMSRRDLHTLSGLYSVAG